MDRTELAWAAGFWDGEGSAYLTGARDRATRQPQGRINQSDHGGMPEVLVRFQGAVAGRGTLHGPERKPGRRDLYYWSASSRAEILDVARLIGPWLGQVKLAQFRDVLGIHIPILAERGVNGSEARDESRAWAAGFWDGEGSIYVQRHRSHAGYFIVEAQLTQSSESGCPAVLERFRSIIGTGAIHGPINDRRAVMPYYRWAETKAPWIRSTVRSLWPWLGPVKKAQAEVALRIVEMQPALPRGNPEWGNRKTRCVNGHEYAAARMRPFRGRGRNTVAPRESRQCLACLREYARAVREDRVEELRMARRKARSR